MSVLQKKAWTELAVMLGCVIVAIPCLAIMVGLDTRGVTYMVISVVAATVSGFVAYRHSIKAAAGLDEREKSILRRAWMLAAHAFVLSIGCVSFIAFFTVGGGGNIPVFALPATFLGALLVAQFVQSAAILIQFARERVDE